MSLSKKLKIAMIELNVNQVELAQRTNQTQANLSKKLKVNNFRLREYEELIHALGCTLEIKIVLPSGKCL